MLGLEAARFSSGRWKHSLPLVSFALVIFETLILGSAAYLLLSSEPDDGQDFSDWIGLAIAIIFITAVLTGARKFQRGPASTPSRRATMRMPVAFGLIASIGFLLIFVIGESSADAVEDGALLQALKAAVAWALCLCMTRSIATGLWDLEAFKRRILVLGTGARAREIARLAAAASYARFTPVGFVSIDRFMPSSSATDTADAGYLLQTAKELRAREIVVAAEDRRGVPVGPLLHCKAEGVDVLDYVAFLEREGGRIDLDALRPSWFLYSDGFGPKPFARWLKRSFDLIVSTTVLLLVLPLLLLAILAIKLESPGPALLRQERTGWRSRRFVLLRLRVGPPESNGMGSAAARGRIGRLIYRLRIDQLPQLWNVIRGDMSLVGPQADRPSIAELLKQEIPFYGERHAMRPGITGWAQVHYPSGARLEDARQKLSYDLYYLKNWGLSRDLLVLMQALGFLMQR